MKRKPLVDWFDGHPLASAIISFFLPGIPHILMGEIAIGLVLLLFGFGSIPFIVFGGLGGAISFITRIIATFLAYGLPEKVYEKEVNVG